MVLLRGLQALACASTNYPKEKRHTKPHKTKTAAKWLP